MDMGEPVLPFFWTFFCVYGGTVIIYLAAVVYMFSYLRRAHPQTWTEIGSPSFLNNSVKNNFLFLGFIFRRRYCALGDEKLNRLCLLILVLFGVCSVMFVAFGWMIFHPQP